MPDTNARGWRNQRIPQNPDDEVAANPVANGVEAALQVLKSSCGTEQQWNQDVQRGSRYCANVSNASAYTQNWSRSLSVHDSGVRESLSLLPHSYVITTTNGRIDTSEPDPYSEVLGDTQSSSVTIFAGASLASTTVGVDAIGPAPSQNTSAIRYQSPTNCELVEQLERIV